MKEILIRADDLGYSRSVNYGIFDSVHNGIINNVGIMVNMPSTKMGLNLLKGEDIDLGLHTNISNGKPILSPKDIPSLVDKNGEFRKSKDYRKNAAEGKKDWVVLDEVVAEIDAQYHKFLNLVGCKPDYFEGHAIMSHNFQKGLKIVAAKYDVPFLDFPIKKYVSFKNKTKFLPILGGYKNGKIDKDYNPMQLLENAVNMSNDKEIPMIISHAGYIDQYLFEHSSLIIPRIKEAAVWTSYQTKKYLKENNVKLLRYSECQ